MFKNSIIVVLGLIIVLLLIAAYTGYFNRNGTDSASQLKATLSKLEHDVKVLTIRDTAWTKHVKLTRDSLAQERKNVEYWKRKYKEPITVTKTEIKEVFKQDSATITKEVKKGIICDSLQTKQSLEIETLNHAMAGFDSLVLVKNLEILKLHGIDSTHLKIESKLKTQVKRRGLVEGALVIVLLLTLILH